MLPYNERAADLVSDCPIAVMVLADDEYSDCDFMPLRPRTADESMWADLKARWPGRQLSARGVVGLRGLTPVCEFKEPLPNAVVPRLAAALTEYFRVLLAKGFAKQMETAEIAELERIYNYADPSAPQV